MTTIQRDKDGEPGGRFVSTGSLPKGDLVRSYVAEAHDRFRSTSDGTNSQVYPALAEAEPDLFGICIVGLDGQTYAAGDADAGFTIMSGAKPFVFALVCMAIGSEEARNLVGMNATGLPFNSLAAVEDDAEGKTNPMVNAGAITTTSLISGDTVDGKWAVIQEGLSRFAGRSLTIDEEVFRSASATNHRNRAIANLLRSYGKPYCDPDMALELYTRQSALLVTARDLAVMGATLAHGGVNPLTGEQVVDQAACRSTLAAMVTSGLYETSGDWLWDVGLPGKSGIGGGIVTVSPGKGGLGTFSPPLDAAGNSVRGQLAAQFLSHRLGLDLLASPRPDVPAGAVAAVTPGPES
jgi:glutaminase